MGIIKIKLAVDRSRHRVLFADAGSDFVDILVGFLRLPLSAVQRVAGLSSPCCLTNLSDSVNHLRNSELLKVDVCRGILLTSTDTDEFNEVWNTETFLRGKERFVISDEWTIRSAYTRSILSLPQAFGSDGIGHGFEEVEVCVGSAEVASLLKASLSSDTVFTDAFLSKGTDDQSARLTVKPSINHKILHQSNKVGCVIKNTGAGISHLGRSFNNLYRSTIDLDATGFLTGHFPKQMLDSSLTPFDILSHIMCRALDCLFPKDRMPELTCYCCHPELVEDRKYVVDDDLLIHQASAMSVMKHWCMRNKAKVLEMDITIGKQETVALLRAVLTSKTALTDVFISRLEEQSSLQISCTVAEYKPRQSMYHHLQILQKAMLLNPSAI